MSENNVIIERDPNWTIEREFLRGQVFFARLQGEDPVPPDDSYVMEGDHRVVVLFDSEFPNNTVTIVPITSRLDEHGKEKHLNLTDVELFVEEYEEAGRPFKGIIRHNSIIRPEQITTISRHLLERQIGEVLKRDMLELDVKLIMTLGLDETVNQMIQAEVQKRLAQSMAKAENE